MSGRKLPVYLVLDTSGSMDGEPIEAVRNGMQTLTDALRNDPYALESAHLSVITFDSDAQQVVPLTDLFSFQPPMIEAGGETCLGKGLELLANCIETEVRKNTVDVRGDWKPLVFIMTDGEPTDVWQEGLERLKQVRCGVIVACGAGHAANSSVLKQITANTVMLDTANSSTISAFFRWVSSSIAIGSQRIETGKKDANGMSDFPTMPAEFRLMP